MDNFEFKPDQEVNRKPVMIWNILTVLVLLGILCLGCYFLSIFTNPNSPLNPFPPALLPPLFKTYTPTATIIPQPATWTPTITIQPTASRTKAATWTLLPEMITPLVTETPTIMPNALTKTITTTAMPALAKITYLPSTDFHPDKACNWLGVAGKVLGTDGKPLAFQEIQMGGTLNGKNVSYLTVSGTASVYGPSGFEFVLSDHAITSTQTLWIQLLDNTAKPLTNKIYFDTYTDCTKNLVMVTFTKTR
jgi:hypothetical protein